MAPLEIQDVLQAFVEESDSDSETVTGEVVPNEFVFLSISDSEDSDIELIEIKEKARKATHLVHREARRTPPLSSNKLKNAQTKLPYIEEPSYRVNSALEIKVGDTVELKGTSIYKADELHSGDFLRVKLIIKNLETDETRLRGYRLRRTKYHGQIFDWKLNELVMDLPVTKDDPRNAFVQGMEEISVEDVVGKRECVITSKPYPLLSFRRVDSGLAFLASMSQDEQKQVIFHQGRLVCRCVHIRVIEPSKKSYNGEIRGLYAREADMSPSPTSSPEGSSSRTSISGDSDEGFVVVHPRRTSKSGKRPKRSPSLEDLGVRPPKRRPSFPVKNGLYTFGDIFSGAGGASQGAVQAGLFVNFGVDFNHPAIQAYGYNHPRAEAVLMNAHDFASFESTADIPKNVLRVDILHLSPPCCYFSPAHTNPGQNDQANYEAIYTVGPILAKLKPRIVTLEQTYGLLTHEEHSKIFKLLMNDIYKADYNARYKIQDMSEFGLPQRRKRLFIIAARRGTPLPPFPKPTHGPDGSGLKRYVSVADALGPLNRLSPQVRFEDDYHQPGDMRPINKQPYNPHNNFLKGCITTGGGENYHFSGKRKYTPREMALFQSFPIYYQFTGSNGEAMKQIGNAFPPVMAEALYRSCAQTLEAFDHGLIEAEAHIEDLDALLAPERAAPPDLFSASDSFSSQHSTPNSPYRYLSRPANTIPSTSASGASTKKPTLFGHKIAPGPQQEPKEKKPYSFFGFMGDSDAGPGVEERAQKNKEGMSEYQKQFWEEIEGAISDSESD